MRADTIISSISIIREAKTNNKKYDENELQPTTKGKLDLIRKL